MCVRASDYRVRLVVDESLTMTSVGLTLIWMFHHLVQLHSQWGIKGWSGPQSRIELAVPSLPLVMGPNNKNRSTKNNNREFVARGPKCHLRSLQTEQAVSLDTCHFYFPSYPILPDSHLPKQNRAGSGLSKFKDNPTQVSQVRHRQTHPVQGVPSTRASELG